MKQILFRIAETTASRITWPKLIENTPVKSHETALEYVEHFNEAFLCHIHYCFNPETKGAAFHKARKLFFIDPLLYAVGFCWREGISNIFDWLGQNLKDSSFRGNLFEAVVVNEAARKFGNVFYWYSSKNQKEVDLVLYQNRIIKIFEIKLSIVKPERILGQTTDLITPQNLENFLTQS